MNFYNHHIRSIFKSHSISLTFKFCAVCIALCALEPWSTDSLGTQHHANFESHSNRVTFETNAIMMIVKVHPQNVLMSKENWPINRMIELERWLLQRVTVHTILKLLVKNASIFTTSTWEQFVASRKKLKFDYNNDFRQISQQDVKFLR